MIAIRPEKPADIAAREALLDVAYGVSRFAKPSQRLREGREPTFSFVAFEHGRLIGTVRLWTVSAGAGRPALLLGPLAVPPHFRQRRSGSPLVGVWAGAGRPALLLGPLAVQPNCRQRGIGSALMRRAIRVARVAGHRA